MRKIEKRKRVILILGIISIVMVSLCYLPCGESLFDPQDRLIGEVYAYDILAFSGLFFPLLTVCYSFWTLFSWVEKN